MDFLLEADTKANLKFASLQGETAKKLLAPSYLYETDTVIFINSSHDVLTKSNAIIDILKTLGGFWKATGLLSFIPSFFLDGIYNLLSHNRYNWFGKRDQCRVPTSEEKDRVLP